jgi:hypothetical protein
MKRFLVEYTDDDCEGSPSPILSTDDMELAIVTAQYRVKKEYHSYARILDLEHMLVAHFSWEDGKFEIETPSWNLITDWETK